MKCKYYVIGDNGFTFCAFIDNNGVGISRGNEIQMLGVAQKKCFNTLISLFSLKNNWNKKDCENPVYKIVFENGEKQDVYFFDASNVPNNFVMFTNYISKLVGESI